MRKKIMLACLCVILVCLVLLAADGVPRQGRREQEPEGLRVALSQAEALTPWKTAQINSFKEAAAQRGLKLIYHSPEEESLAWQLADIRGLLETGIDYLILIPRVRTGYDEILQEAKEQGVTVILAEQDVEMEVGTDPAYNQEDYYISYVAPDYKQEGELCADILADYFGIQPCHTMVIQGEKESGMAWERYLGFMHGVRRHSNLYVSKRVESNGSRLTAQKATELVVADRDIDFNAVFAPSDEDGLGVLQALKLAGVDPGKDVVIVSIEGIQDVFKAIIAEEYLATVKSDPEYGEPVFDLIEKRERGESVPRRVLTANRIYTVENAEAFFEDAY